MEHHVKVWNIKVTTVEQPGEDSDVNCGNCEAPCCKGIFVPLLTEKEFFSGKYPIKVIDVPEFKDKLPSAENIIGLAVLKNGCIFLKDNKCSIYEDRPKACRIYDCRKDNRKEIKEFVEERFN